MLQNKKIILVVCRGNITRSPFAEKVIENELKLRKLDGEFRVVSRGTQGTRVDPIPVKFPNVTFYREDYLFSKPTLDKFQIDITKHVSKIVDDSIAKESAIILAVDERNRVALLQLFPDLERKIFKLSELVGSSEDFDDPNTVNGFDKHFEILSGIRNTVIEGFPKLLSLANNSEKA